MTRFTPPTRDATAFNCPHCNAYAHQEWYSVCGGSGGSIYGVKDWHLSKCRHCGEEAFWLGNRLMFPENSSAPLPSPDLPIEIRKDFAEARSIVQRSPRGAAALFRLCIQKLCKHLGESGTNINDDIAALVKKGLHVKIQQSLDIVRVVGNEAVHPGEMDLRDKPETAVQLAALINLIADAMITQPKMVENLYSQLPENKLKGIEGRDAK